LLVSVVIPAYNRSDYIGETIASVLAQSYSNLEILIIDDFSDDATEKVVMEEISAHPGKIRYFKNEMRKGVSGARNTGLKHAKGKYIAFLDDDDLWDRSKLKVQVDLLESHKDVGALFSDVSFFGDVKNGYGVAPYRKELFSSRFWGEYNSETLIAKKNIVNFLLRNGSPFRIQTFIFRKEYLDKIGTFTEDMRYYEDVDFLLRFFCLYKVGYLRKKLCRIRRHSFNSDNIIDNREKQEAEIKLVQGLINFNKANGMVWDSRLMNAALADAYIRMATFCFREYNFNEAKKNLNDSLKNQVKMKSAVRLCLLYMLPEPILKKIVSIISQKKDINSHKPESMLLRNIMYLEGSISFGGSTADLLNIINNLNREHYKPVVVTLYFGEHVEILKNRIKDVVALTPKFFDNGRLLKVTLIRLYHFIKILLFIKDKHIDIIHFNNFVYYPGILAAKLSRIPCVCHLRSLPVGYHTRKTGVTFLTKFFSRFIDCFIAVSEAVKREYVIQGFNSKKISVIGTGIFIKDIQKKAAIKDLRSEFKVAKDEFIIGTVARLSWEKGIINLIEAMPSILEKMHNIKCFIVGGGPLENELKERVNALGLRKNVILTGKTDNPYYILSSFDVFVLPSLKEGQGIVVMEAMALGIPVVASRVGGIIELVEEGIDGILIEPGNANSIYRTALSLLSDKTLRNKLSRNALIKTESKFLIKDKVEKIEKIYEKLLS